MIGEDFRSQARENLLHGGELEQRIKTLEEEIIKLKEVIDEKDMAYVVQNRELESYMR